MTDAELRDQAVAALEATTITYPAWVKKVADGKYSPKDGSGTYWGKAFAALAQIGVTPPPPPPPPPALGTITHVASPWDNWPKAKTRADWNLAPVIAQAKHQTLLSASVAAADAAIGTPVVTGPFGGRTLHVPVPPGTTHGGSYDQHLTIYDPVFALETDMWQANGPPVTSAQGCAQFPAGAASEDNGNSNAAMLPLRRGLILPSDVAGAVIHPLVFAIDVAGSGAPVYPSATDPAYAGKGAGLPPWGARLGFPAGTTWPKLDALSDYVCRCLADPHGGMFLRDLGTGGSLTIYGLDAINQGGAATWAAAGVTLQPNATLTPPLYYAVLSPLIPWDKLEAYDPPTP